MSQSNKDIMIQHSQRWLEEVVIAHNFCPFAKREFLKKSILFDVIPLTKMEECLESLIVACEKLDDDASIETMLLIFPNGFSNFEDYLDLVDYADRLLEAQNYEGVYQLASFHPDYCFDETEPNDPANYTNRSPYPMLHLLREASIERVLESVEDPDAIPQNNIERAKSLGIGHLKQQLENCFRTTE